MYPNRQAQPTLSAFEDAEIQAWWLVLDCRFTQVHAVFESCATAARQKMAATLIPEYLNVARQLGKLGRGYEPMLAFLERWPEVVEALHDDSAALLTKVMAFIAAMQKSPNTAVMMPFLNALAPVAKRLRANDAMKQYLAICADVMNRSTGSIHGHQKTLPSPALPGLITSAPEILMVSNLAGLKNWAEYGLIHHADNPDSQAAYFRLTSSDSKAVLTRERHGTLFADHERRLILIQRALWEDDSMLIPYSNATNGADTDDDIRQLQPYFDHLGMRIPDAYDAFKTGNADVREVSGINRYVLTLAHMVGHKRWSTPLIADNWSPFQRLAVEFFEDARIDNLIVRRYPGLRPIILALHPTPMENACDDKVASCLRHRLSMFSRACLDEAHPYISETLLDFVGRFHQIIADEKTNNSAEIAKLALTYVAKTRRASDQFANVVFADTEINYRDDNRHLWQFIEAGDEEETSGDVRENEADEVQHLPPRHYPEWDYRGGHFRPDWVCLYESLHPARSSQKIETLLAKHNDLAKRLKRILDVLKPQSRRRLRYQEAGSELDLDIAINALIDLKSGQTPDPRINESHTTDGRSIAVLLLLDLSESLNNKVPGSADSILTLAQESVAILAWALSILGDPLAIAGFRSNTRNEVRYLHIKGFSEPWGDEVKSRLSAMEAAWSTRMGAAMRHAAHYLKNSRADKRIMLVLTDGEPADIDESDADYLKWDCKKAVDEVAAQGITPFCLNLDAKADGYVRDIFGSRFRVLDHIERLPEVLPQVYLRLTK